MQIQTNTPVLLFDGGTTNTVEIRTWYEDIENKIFWVTVLVGQFPEKVPIWSGNIYNKKINNWNITSLAKDVKAFYENDRGIVDDKMIVTNANWDMFNLSMMSNPRFNEVYIGCLNVAPIVANALPTALDQVTSKGTTLFNLVFNQICSIGGATAGDRLAWGAIAQDNNLPIEFINILKG